MAGKKSVTNDGLCIIVYSLCVALMGSVDVFVLAAKCGAAATAEYGVALRYYGMTLMFINAVNTVLLPRAVAARDKADLARLVGDTKAIALIGVLCLLAAFLFAPAAIGAIDGAKYPESPKLVRILLLASLSSVLFSPYVNILIAAKDIQFMVFAALVAAAIAVCTHLLLISRFGSTGAATSTSISFGTLNVIVYLRSKKIIGNRNR
jgi:O-antigen/teichoic acid export membrane protein